MITNGKTADKATISYFSLICELPYFLNLRKSKSESCHGEIVVLLINKTVIYILNLYLGHQKYIKRNVLFLVAKEKFLLFSV